MSEMDPHTLDEAWRAAWKASPLPEYPVSGADLAAFNYGRDCAAAAVKALRDIHPIRERRKHQDAIAASRIDARRGETGTGSISEADESLTAASGDAQTLAPVHKKEDK